MVGLFGNIFRLATGDFLAKTLNFLAFVYLARTLGVTTFGVLEFAISIMVYFLLLGDAGLELWSTREAAKAHDSPALVGRIVPLRLLFGALSFVVLVILLPFLPDFPGLRLVVVLFGLTLFTQATSLKWYVLGREKMGRVAAGLVLGQAIFAGGVFAVVHGPESLIWVPVMRLVGELALVGYFAWVASRLQGGLRLQLSLVGTRPMLRPAFTMGMSHGLALVNYNFDTVLLGLLVGATAVGWYSAAYKPVTIALAVPVTYFLGLFPPLSRTYAEDREQFRRVVARSLRLTAVFAVPLGVGVTFLAEPIIALLFGREFMNSVPVLQVLSWSAVLVILRGTYRQALNAAGRPGLDLRCAIVASVVNVTLNLVLIPRYGMMGAAGATVISEVVWLTMASYNFHRHVAQGSLLPFLLRPVAAGLVMGACLWIAEPLQWVARGALSVGVYFTTLLLAGETEFRL